MRRFYSTIPKADEPVLDYWIKLNRAIDTVNNCFQRDDKCIENPSAEVVMILVSHCHYPNLAVSLKFKSAEVWTAFKFQERLDNHTHAMKSDVCVVPAHKKRYINPMLPSEVMHYSTPFI